MLSISGYARHRGVSRQYVQKLVRTGRVELVDGLIDRDGADRILAGAADPAKQVARAPTARAIGAPGEPAAPPIPPGFETPVQRATAEDRQLSADLKRLRIQRESREVVDAAGVARSVAENADATIRLLETMPDRLSARVAAESDVRKVHAMLTAEIDECRRMIARAARAIQEAVAPTN